MSTTLKFDEVVLTKEMNGENFKGWTRWTTMTGFDGHNDCVYRSNGKKVQIKFLTSNVRAEACCCKDDDFNLAFGLNLAYLRAMNKALTKKRIELEEELNSVEHDIARNKTIMKKMVNSLD